MKIRVRAVEKPKQDNKKKGKTKIRRVWLWLPNSLLKSRLGIKIIKSSVESKKDKDGMQMISSDFVTAPFVKLLHKSLKAVIKENGHFNLVEVNAADGTKVLIRV